MAERSNVFTSGERLEGLKVTAIRGGDMEWGDDEVERTRTGKGGVRGARGTREKKEKVILQAKTFVIPRGDRKTIYLGPGKLWSSSI